VQPNLRVNVTNQGYRHCCFAPFFRRERSRGGRELCQFLLPARQPQLREGRSCSPAIIASASGWSPRFCASRHWWHLPATATAEKKSNAAADTPLARYGAMARAPLGACFRKTRSESLPRRATVLDPDTAW